MHAASQDFSGAAIGSSRLPACSRSRRWAWVVLAALAITPAGTFANKRGGSLPAAVLAARTIYIDNQTTDAGLQNNAYLALAKWGRFQVADSAEKADVVLRLSGSSSVRAVPSDTRPDMTMASGKTGAGGASLVPNGETGAPDGFTRLTLLDGKTGNAVWSDLSKTNSAQAATHILDGLREAFEQARKTR